MVVKVREWATWVVAREIWPMVVGVALATFMVRWALWGLGLIALLWLVRWIGRGQLTVPTPLDWPMCLMLLMVPVTFYATTDTHTTFVGVSRLLAGLGLTYGLTNWARCRSRISLVVLGLTSLGLALALAAPVTVGWFSGVKSLLIPGRIYELLPTLVSDTVHPNMMAGALVMLLPFPLATLLLSSPSALPRIAGAGSAAIARGVDKLWFRWVLYVLAALLMFGALVLTKSRGGWIAGATGLFLVLVRRQQRLLIWLIPVGLLGMGLLVWQGDLPALLDMISASGAISGWAGRVEIWSRAVHMIRDFPFTGVGVGTFQPVANVLYPFLLIEPGPETYHAHNLLLQVGVDLGLPGLVAYLAILLLALWCALDSARFYHQAGEEALAAVAWASLTSLVAMLVHGVLDAPTWITGRGAFVPWAVIGLAVGLHEVAGDMRRR
jgi:putative inorganic carbon (HCO3(-)) transporter